MQSAGGPCVVVMILFLHIMSSSSIIFADWWLSEWVTTDKVRRTKVFNNVSSALLRNTTNVSIDLTTVDVSATEDGRLSHNTHLLVYNCALAGLFIMQFMKSITDAKVAINASNSLHDKCIGNIMKATMDFFKSNPVGRILNRFSRDLDEIDVYLPQITQELLDISTLIVLSLLMSVYVTPWLLVTVVPIVTTFYFLQKISSVAIRQLKRFEHVSRSPLISEVGRTTEGLATIVVYDQQQRFIERFIQVGNVASMSQFLFDVGVRWIVIRFDLLAGLLTTSASLIFATDTLQLLIKLTNNTEAHFTAVERLHEYTEDIDLEPQDADTSANNPWLDDGGNIEFRDVCVQYRCSVQPVLRSVSFKVKSGEKVGIIGRTGAGKSTLVNALSRLVEVSSGSIFVDNEDISKLPLCKLRSHIATITQDPVLFAGNVRFNLDPFSRCSDTILWSALEKVHMKQKIEQYHKGLETLVLENGENFSVGERQLLCLARVLTQSNKILVLDEATANVDTFTAELIQQTLREAFSHCTVLYIAHRLNTVLQCDQIIVLENGKVIENGSPNELFSHEDSQFRAMMCAQELDMTSYN